MNRDIQAALEGTLSGCSGVADCVALPRGDEWIAFVVPDGPWRPEALAIEMRAAASRLPAPTYIPIAAVPRMLDGAVDESALRRIPAEDDSLAAAWESAIASLPGVLDVAAIVEPYQPDMSAVHVSELWPDWRRRSGTAAADPAPSARAGATVPRTSTRLSFSEGPPLVVSSSAPRTLGDALKRAAAGPAQHGVTYVRSDGSDWHQSYGDLLAEATCILTGLRAAGCKPGERVLFQFADAHDFLPTFWGCVLGGFVPVPVAVAPSYSQPNATLSKLRHAWALLNRPLIATNAALAPSIEAAGSGSSLGEWRVTTVEALRDHSAANTWHSNAPDDVALLLLTSGSTGTPKAVMQSHRAILSRSLASCAYDAFTTDDVSLNWFPLDHVGGLVMYHLRDVYALCPQIQAPTTYVLESPRRWLDLIDRYRATVTWAPNFAFGLINAHAEDVASGTWDLSSMRFILNGGEAIVARTARRFLEILAPHGLPATAMRPAWGMSETCSGITSSHSFTLASTHDDAAAVDVGPPLPGVALRIVDENDCPIPEGRIGRLQVKGPSITSGYYKHDEANREAFTTDGWFTTGDLGHLVDGRLTITGRQKDVIIINGINYPCQEIEACVEEIPGVDVSFTAACAARLAGCETDELAVVFHPTVTGDRALANVLTEIRRSIVQKMGISPSYLVPVDRTAIPKTEIGKIQRARIREQLEAGAFEPELRRVDVLLETAATVPDWFTRTVWRHEEARQARSADGNVLLLAPTAATEDLWAHAIRQRGVAVVSACDGTGFVRLGPDRFELAPNEPEHYERLLAMCAASGTAIQRIVDARNCGSPNGANPTTSREIAEQGGATAFIALARALSHLDSAVPRVNHLLLVASHSQLVNPGDVLACERTPAIGLLQAFATEQPGMRCTHLDVPLDPESAIGPILQELDRIVDFEVAYRDGRRFVRRLEAVDLRGTEPGPPAFTDDGFYVVTGGLGGIGKALVADVLTSNRSRLLLFGRNGLDVSETRMKYEELQRVAKRDGGAVLYASVDLADISAIREAVRHAASAWGQPLKGIVHLAGAYHDRPVSEESADSLAEVWDSKVAGTRALHALLADTADAWFLGFSSAVSFFGGATVGAYAGANRFLESESAVARQRGLRSRTLAWSTWDQVGMSRGHAGTAALRARGFRDMAPAQALRSMRAAFERDAGHLIVGLDRRNRFIRRHLASGPVHLNQITAFAVSDAPAAVEAAVSAISMSDRFGTATPCTLAFAPALPKQADGTVDRARLLAPSSTERRHPPQTEAERRVADVWHEVMGGAPPSVDDNFFELGGHSLLATQMLSRLNARWGVELPLRALFESPTVRELAAHFATAPGGHAEGTPALVAVARDRHLPLSFAQQRLWFLDQLEAGNWSYNIPCAFWLRGTLDVRALEQSLTTIVARHEALRTRFDVVDGQPSQVVMPTAPVAIVRVNLSEVAEAEREAAAREAAFMEARRPFDLARGPLMRVMLLELDARTHWLLMTLHHIVADGWSLDVLSRELSALYDAFSTGRSSPLPGLSVQYADYAVWQRDRLQGEHLEREISHWTRTLAGAPTTLTLPTDYPRPPIRSSRGRKYEFVLSPALLAAANRFGQGTQTTLFVTLLAGFRAFLFAYTGQSDAVLGSPVAGRPRPELEPLIGFFANTLVLRSTVSEEASFKTLVAAAATAALEAFAHQEVPFEKLVEVMQPPRDRSRNPIFQVNFRVVVAPVAPLALRGLEVSPLELIDTATSKFDLALEVAGIDGGTSYFEYSADLFEERTIRRMHADFERLLAGLLARPDDPLRTLAAFEEIRDRGPRAPVTKVTVSRRAVGLSHRSKGADAET